MAWQYDEYKHCGVDYSEAKQAEEYDKQHQKFRNYEDEFKKLIGFLEIDNPEDMILIDLGCGTGALSINAAEVFKLVYAVDVSDVMIDQAKHKINPKLHKPKFINAGFLSYDHEGELADLVITKAALHHLPDFWKQIALQRINKMLKMEGLLYIHDVVFQFDPNEYASKINAWISEFSKRAGEGFKQEIETHIRDEFSTFGWIFQGMLEKAGFRIEKFRSEDGFVSEYLCRKINT